MTDPKPHTESPAAPQRIPVTVSVGERAPLRDGLRLAVDRWHPLVAPDLRPAVLTLTPYGRDGCADMGRFFAERGFTFIAADCRGRGESEGVFALYGDGDDYADLVAWAAAQPWCSGEVFTQGGSYAGINQWQVAARRPAALCAIAPLVAPVPGPYADTLNGIAITYNLAWATLVQGRSTKWPLFNDQVLWRDIAHDLYRRRLPTPEWASCVTPKPNPVLQVLLAEFGPRAFDHAVPTAGQFAAIDIPVLNITGLYDNAQVGALQYWRRHEAAAGEQWHAQRFLVIGPSAHGGRRPLSANDTTLQGDDALDTGVWQDSLCADFYHWALGNAVRPGLLANRVNVFIAGLESWVHAPDLLSLSYRAVTLFPGGDALGDGPEAGADVCFNNHPLDERYAALEAQEAVGSLLGALSCETPLETGFAQHLFGQGHIWQSAPLRECMLLCGTPELTLRLASSTPDADLLAALIKQCPDGRQVVLSSTLLRLRHRDGLDRPPRLMTPGVAETVRFPEMRFTATKVQAGCRLRLVLRVPASIAMERNMNAAAPVGLHTLVDAQAGTVRVLAGAESRLVLPLLDEALPRSAPAP
jgi:hypothetical protein